MSVDSSTINDPENDELGSKADILDIIDKHDDHDESETETRTTSRTRSSLIKGVSSTESDNFATNKSVAAFHRNDNNNIECDISNESKKANNSEERVNNEKKIEANTSNSNCRELTAESNVGAESLEYEKHEEIIVDEVPNIVHTERDEDGREELNTAAPETTCTDIRNGTKRVEQSIEDEDSSKGDRTEEPIEIDQTKDEWDSKDETQEDPCVALNSADESWQQQNLLSPEYKEGDFTDSTNDSIISDSDSTEKKTQNRSDHEEMGAVQNKLGSKGKTSDKEKAPKKQKCQGSSSEDENERPCQNKRPQKKKQSRLSDRKKNWSHRDTKLYRDGYPGKHDDLRKNKNLQFYQGEIRSKPDGMYIDEYHKHWWADYDRLEHEHGFIQWLFPIRETGMNWHAQELQLHEAKGIQKDPAAFRRFLKSYKMMLNFYGIKLTDEKTGSVDKADNCVQRFRHLNYSHHNYLRITRILKCLGEMGLEDYKEPFLRFMLQEAIVTGRLNRTLDSCYTYWIGTVHDDQKREALESWAEELYQQQQ